MKLLMQGDDFGFTRAVTDGIVDSIDFGVLRNTGLFANMPAAEYAVSFMKDRPHVCFGIDFNLVAGRPVSKPEDVPHLVDDKGFFIKSGVRIRDERWQSEEGRAELFPYDEVNRELRAQFDRFIQLTGRKPGYLHSHSISSENYRKVIREISAQHDIPFSADIWDRLGMRTSFDLIFKKSLASMKKVFDPNDQLNKDTVAQFLEVGEEMLKVPYNAFCCHPGYIDAELLEMTTLSLERCKDAKMMMSEKIADWIRENGVELITYDDLRGL